MSQNRILTNGTEKRGGYSGSQSGQGARPPRIPSGYANQGRSANGTGGNAQPTPRTGTQGR
jgi:hypothetical protein